MPGWKRDVGRRIDTVIALTVPKCRKAVKWNTPFYGTGTQGWLLGFHCLTKCVKVAFFRGTALRPPPPGESKQKTVRYLSIYEDSPLDEAHFGMWVKQANNYPAKISESVTVVPENSAHAALECLSKTPIVR